MTSRVITGDCREVLATLDAGSVQCCVSSPPYYGLRAYLPDGHPDKAREIGAEQSPDAYVAEMVAVFREIRRVLADSGCVFLNLGDAYADKQLLMMPARVALALQADAWVLRSDIIWAKPNPMPESVTSRPTSAHEHVFLLSKRASYFWDQEAVREAGSDDSHGGAPIEGGLKQAAIGQQVGGRMGIPAAENGRNCRSVWTIATQPYSGSHFATMPADLAERCIKAGTRPGDTVLDPFAGAGTTLLCADRLGRNGIGIELNPAYAVMARNRLTDDCPLFADVAD